MGRFMTVLGLAMVGLVGVVYSGFVQRAAFIVAFVTAAVLPLVLNPTRHWRQAFWRCIDIVYAASFIGASLAAHAIHAPRLQAFGASVIPGLLFGTMASLGVGRSGLGEISK